MALVYIGLTDEDVRQDYQKVLGADAIIAGPGAERVRSGEFAEAELRWLRKITSRRSSSWGVVCVSPRRGHVSAICISPAPSSSPRRSTLLVCVDAEGLSKNSWKMPVSTAGSGR